MKLHRPAKAAGFLLLMVALFVPLWLILDYQTVVVEYTASLDGHLDGCECWGDPIAGLVKRAVRYRGEAPGVGNPEPPDLLLDAGNILSPGNDPELSRHILESYRELGYDLVALGNQEFSDGVGALQEYLQVYPLGSHNLSLVGETNLREPVVREFGSITVAVLSLTGEESFHAYPPELRKAFLLEDPVVAATRALDRLEPPNHLLLLYHGSRDGAERLASSVPGVDAVIYGHEQELTDVVLPGGTRLLSPGEHGNQVGRLMLRSRRALFSGARLSLGSKNSFVFFDYLEDPDDPALRNRIVAYEAHREAQIAAMTEHAPAPSSADTPVEALYYYSPGCKECREFLREEAPRLLSRLPFPVELRRRNILNPAVYEEFEAVLHRRGRRNDEFPLLLVGDRILQGTEEIESRIEELLIAYGEGREPAVGIRLLPESEESAEAKLSLLPIMAAGLLDGVNPCVFTALIFLASSLLLLKKERRELMLLGVTFIATVYVTYFLLGLGMFAGLRLFAEVPTITRAFRYLLGASLIVLALLSLRDAWYARIGKSQSMVLRLPKRVQERVHQEIRGYRHRGAMLGGTIAVAVLITMLELGCTGQIYLPTLAYYARTSMRAVSLLAAYNVAFVLPLTVLFVAVVAGVSTNRIRRLFLSSLPSVRVASAFLFATFAAALFFF